MNYQKKQKHKPDLLYFGLHSILYYDCIFIYDFGIDFSLKFTFFFR